MNYTKEQLDAISDYEKWTKIKLTESEKQNAAVFFTYGSVHAKREALQMVREFQNNTMYNLPQKI